MTRQSIFKKLGILFVRFADEWMPGSGPGMTPNTWRGPGQIDNAFSRIPAKTIP
jgi:hypothetical protein